MARPRCPNCGEPVSPFAAGCALCGADLDAHRAQQRPPRRLPSVRVPLPRRLAQTRLDLADVLFLAAGFVLALGAPIFGLALALLVAADRHRSSEETMRNAMLVLAAFAATQLVPSLALFPRVLSF